MGVVTTAYAVPASLVKKIRKDNEVIGQIIEPEDDSSAVASFDFDTTIEAWVSVLRASKHDKTARNIDSERFDTGALEYDSYDMWLVPPSQVKAMARELKSATFEQLKAAGLAAEITDRRGTKLLDSEFAGYFTAIEKLKTFLHSAAEQGHYLLFTEA